LSQALRADEKERVAGTVKKPKETGIGKLRDTLLNLPDCDSL
jgi:hypothetical protein